MSQSLDLSVVEVERFLVALGAENVERTKDDELKFSCLFPGHNHGDSDPSAYMNTGEADPEKTTLWKCFGCGRGGTAIDFLALREDCSFEQAKIWLREEFGGEFREPGDGGFGAEWDDLFVAEETDSPESVVNPPLPEDTLDLFRGAVGWSEVADDYMLGRGFSRDTLDRWQVGWDPWTGRYTIPVRREDGALIGFKARTPSPSVEPRYLILGDLPGLPERYGFAPYSAGHVLFGLDRVGEREEGVLVEGELNVMAAEQKGFDNFVGLGGSSLLSAAQVLLLRRHFDSVVLFYDSLRRAPADQVGPRILPDRAGLTATARAIELLEPFLRVRLTDYHLDDPADMEAVRIGSLVREAVSSVRVTLL